MPETKTYFKKMNLINLLCCKGSPDFWILEPIPSGWVVDISHMYTIKHVKTGLYLNVAGDDRGANARIILYNTPESNNSIFSVFEGGTKDGTKGLYCFKGYNNPYRISLAENGSLRMKPSKDDEPKNYKIFASHYYFTIK